MITVLIALDTRSRLSLVAPTYLVRRASPWSDTIACKNLGVAPKSQQLWLQHCTPLVKNV